MQFNFDGLDEPIILPDEYLKVRQFQRLQKALHVHDHLKEADYFDYLRLCVADTFSIEDLISKTDELDMTPHNAETWKQIEIHVSKLVVASETVGDEETNEGLSDPLAEAPTESETPTASE